ncbi:MAG TPA: pilus assembly protein TadG-related protein [Bryobacteraceae bacterium]|nr:pilus assembly protein TadG-related protein [Bryobacteraceae bacterium]
MAATVRRGQLSRRSGFTLIAAAVCSFVVIGATGLAVDIGRMYIARNELQAFVDAAAIAATQQLDGTTSGLNRAQTAAQNTPNKWNLNTQQVTNVLVDFSQPDPGGGLNFAWAAAPNPATLYSVVRVRANAPVPLFFISGLAGRNASFVAAQAIGAQTPVTTFRQGLFPFSPFGHLFEIGTPGAPPCGSPMTQGCRDQVSGLIVGNEYTLRWPSNPSLGNGNNGSGSNMCSGDRASGQTIIDIANSAGASERGFIENTAASVSRETVVNDYQSITRSVGDLVTMTGGAMQTIYDALQERILQDTNQAATNASAYFGAPHNNRRVVACLINDGTVVNGNQFRSIEVGAFLLLPGATYGSGGNQAWCAVYLGPYCQGCLGSAAGSSGAYVVRLLQ